MGGTWIFGYGSLIYRPGFDFSKRVEGYIKGYKRVFHQGSTDHRGTPEYPGRTVTLAPCPTGTVWGAAYKLAGDDKQQAETLAYLEWREKQYDVRQYVDLYCSHDASPILHNCLVYIASEDTSRNVNYLGPATEDQIALQIATAVGPSGPNYEYVFRLAEAMRQMQVHDEELFSMEGKVQQLLCKMRGGPEVWQGHGAAAGGKLAEQQVAVGAISLAVYGGAVQGEAGGPAAVAVEVVHVEQASMP